MMLDAGAVDDGPDVDHNVYHAKYNIDLTTQLELKDETWVSLPSFNNPVFPLYVEGKIVSEQGKEEEETFQIYQDKDTSVDQYKVSIPLWDNQSVVIPFLAAIFIFRPIKTPGCWWHSIFMRPALKDSSTGVREPVSPWIHKEIEFLLVKPAKAKRP